MKCASKKGFFILRDCGAPAVSRCPTCHKPVCAKHFYGSTCRECGDSEYTEDYSDSQEGDNHHDHNENYNDSFDDHDQDEFDAVVVSEATSFEDDDVDFFDS